MPYGQIVADSITTSDGYVVGGSGAHHLKNRIINGAMTIDQRNAGASVTVNADAAFFASDRFQAAGQGSDGVYTIQRSATAPAGFANSIVATVTTADSSITASQQYNVQQHIEGLNTADLAFGTASAKTVTLSFWVRSSVTGTFSGAIRNAAADRSYPFSYTINAANTFEQKVVTIPGDQSGTWGVGTGIGLNVIWTLGAGTSRLGPANAWAGANYQGVTGQTNLIATNGATWYLTGVQLEAGSTATSYDFRHHSVELAMCQRYYESGSANPSCFADTFGNAVWEGFYKVDKRAAGTLTYDDANGNTGKIARWFTGSYSSNVTPSGLSADGTKKLSGNITGLSAGALVKVGFNWYQNSEL